MQQQTYRQEAAATEKQLDFIRTLQSRDLINEDVDFDSLTKREASAMIDLALTQAKNKAVAEAETASEAEVVIEGDDDIGYEEMLEPEPVEKEPEKVMDSIPKVGHLDKIRFGLSAKLVYGKHEHSLNVPAGVDAFKKEVATTYLVLSDLESEMSG